MKASAWIIILMILNLMFITQVPVHEQTLLPPNRAIVFPTPLSPAVALIGSTFNVTVNAPQNALNWTAQGYGIKLVNNTLISLNTIFYVISTYYNSSSGLWTLSLNVPNTAMPGLYTLQIIFHLGTSVLKYVQEKSVWLLDKWPDKLRIAHFTDVHIGVPEAIGLFTTGIISAQMFNSTVAFITGDDSDTAADWQELTFRQISLFAPTLPIFAIPGNHDAKTAAYDNYVGPRQYFTNIGKFLVIGIDTGENGVTSYNTLQWMQQVLTLHGSNKVKILLMHHPLFSTGVQGYLSTSLSNISTSMLYYSWAANPDIAKALLKTIEDFNITLILAGHVHTDRIVVINSTVTKSLHWFITTTTTGEGRPEYNGFRIIDIDQEGRVTVPFMPPWGKIEQYPNSIPIDKTWAQGYLDAKLVYGNEAVTVNITNTLPYVNLNSIIILNSNSSVPLSNYKMYTNSYGSHASATLLSSISIAGLNYYAIKMSIPSKSGIRITLAPYEDTDVPTGKIVYTLPLQPEPNSPTSVYIQASDTGWGILRVYAEYSYQNKKNIIESIYEQPYYKIRLPGFPPGTVVNITINIIDAADHTATLILPINFSITLTTTTTTTTIVTTTTTPTTTTTTTTKTLTTTSPVSVINPLTIMIIAVVIGIILFVIIVRRK
ncbi:MAG: metallophosphoesterase [Thermoprotei archaeon]